MNSNSNNDKALHDVGGRIWMIPKPNACFTGHDVVLGQIEEAISKMTVGLTGTGGIGKTEIALKFADIHEKEFDEGHFIVSSSLAALDRGLASIASTKLSEDTKDEELQDRKARALQHLQRTEKALLILDNVDDIAQEPEFKRVLAELPSVSKIVTCRHRDLDGICAFDVDKMEPEVGALYLLRDASGKPGQAWEAFDPSDRKDALVLAKELDGMPLALHHAAGTIRAENLSVRELLEEYQTNRERILKNRGKVAASTHRDSLWAMVRLSLNNLAKKNPAAAELAISCAFLAPEAISEDIFTNRWVILLPHLAEQIANYSVVRADALRSGLIGRNVIEKRLTISPLVQTVIQEQVRETVGELLNGLASMAVTSLHNAGRFSEQLAHSEFAYDGYMRLYGVDHVDTLASMNNLANSYFDVGRYEDALKLNGEILLLRRRYLGESHPDTLTSMGNLANVYSALGQHQEALKLKEETLRRVRETLGGAHPTTLASMGNLAATYAHLGRSEEAVKLNEETLELRRQKLGEDHPDTLMSMNNLAASYSDLCRYEEALILQKETFRLMQVNLGDEHPDTLTSMNNLASTYSALGRHEEALKLMEETMRLRREYLGEAHPDTLTSMSNLASTYSALGRHEEALVLMEETLQLRREKLGEDHPDTLASMNNLAATYSALGRHEEAMKLK